MLQLGIMLTYKSTWCLTIALNLKNSRENISPSFLFSHQKWLLSASLRGAIKYMKPCMLIFGHFRDIFACSDQFVPWASCECQFLSFQDFYLTVSCQARKNEWSYKENWRIRWNFQKSIDLSTFMHIPAYPASPGSKSQSNRPIWKIRSTNFLRFL